MRYKIFLPYPNPTSEQWLAEHFKDVSFKYLVSEQKEKIYKKNIEIADEELIADEDEKIIIVGAECLKHLFNESGITKLSGTYQEIPHKKLGMTIHVGLLTDPKVATIYPHKRKEIEQHIKALKETDNNKKTEKNYTIVDFNEQEKATQILNSLMNSDCLVLDLETSSLYPHKGRILGVCLTNKAHTGYYIVWEAVDNLLLQKVLDTAKIIVGHHFKFDYKWLVHNGIYLTDEQVYKVHDTMLLAYLRDENSPHGLKDLAIKYTDLGDYEKPLDRYKKAYCKCNKLKMADFSYEYIPVDILGEYGCKDADATMQLYLEMKDDEKPYAYYLMRDASIELSYVELNGAFIDKDSLNETYSIYAEKVNSLYNRLVEYVAELTDYEIPEFNPNSFQQVGNVLYQWLELPVLETTDTGSPSTSKEVLEKLREKVKSPFLDDLLEYRKVKKFFSTYLESIKNNLDEDGRLRTNFNITGTSSGRLSSSGVINFQNIPSKDKIIKKLFIPEDSENFEFMQADLKTAEVWVAAQESKDPFLQEAFKSGLDFHGFTAQRIFGLTCSVAEVKTKYPEYRQIAKTIVFAILYQAGANRVAEELGISRSKAQEYINFFFENAYVLDTYIKDKIDIIRDTGKITSYFGRTRRVPEVFSSNKGLAEHYVKSAVNFLFQSVASDINLKAFVKGMRRIRNENLDFIPTMLVHDSICGEVRKAHKDRVVAIFKEEVTNAIEDSFYPMTLDVEFGESWGSVK